VTVLHWVDGDTVKTSAGTVRVVGIDTPERGHCGYKEATNNALKYAPVGTQVILVSGKQGQNTDRYGRLLRYVDTIKALDVGFQQISGGFAIARYDSRDGYGSHPRQDLYVTTDNKVPPNCATSGGQASPTTLPTPTASGSGVYYSRCSAVRAAGKAPLHVGDPGYRIGLDGDRDGVACE
jgi:hypothetical protein